MVFFVLFKIFLNFASIIETPSNTTVLSEVFNRFQNFSAPFLASVYSILADPLRLTTSSNNRNNIKEAKKAIIDKVGRYYLGEGEI